VPRANTASGTFSSASAEKMRYALLKFFSSRAAAPYSIGGFPAAEKILLSSFILRLL
jgi:hypothetical protein